MLPFFHPKTQKSNKMFPISFHIPIFASPKGKKKDMFVQKPYSLNSQIIMPSAPLQPFIHHYWVMRAQGNEMGMSIMPTGCMKWMFHRGTPFAINGVLDTSKVATICGQYMQAAHVNIVGDADLIFVFFRPYAMKMITDIPCHLFEDDNIDMEDLEQPDFALLKRMVLDSKDALAAIRIIEDFLLRRLADRGESVYLRQLMTACRQIDLHPDISLNSLSDTACLSERQLRRVFLDYMGMSPKQMIRTKRCYLASKMMQQLTEYDFSEVINHLGFTDHSHLYKEFKIFAGMSPSDYLRHLSDIRQHNLIRGYRAYHD